jgi:hypothetical protein
MLDLGFSWRNYKWVPSSRIWCCVQAIMPMHTALFKVPICPSCACGSSNGSFLLPSPITLLTAPVTPQAYSHLPLVLMPLFSYLSIFASLLPLLLLFISGLPPRPVCNHVFNICLIQLAASFLLVWLILYPEDGGNTFLQSISKLLSDYTSSHSKRQYSLLQSLLKIIITHHLLSSYSLDRIILKWSYESVIF